MCQSLVTLVNAISCSLAYLIFSSQHSVFKIHHSHPQAILYLSSFCALSITYHLLLLFSLSSVYPELFTDLTLRAFLFSFLVTSALHSRMPPLLLSFCLLQSNPCKERVSFKLPLLSNQHVSIQLP